MAQTKLFREAALRRLSNPEQLDRAVYVTTFRGWLATLTLALGAAAAVAWSIEGEVSTYVAAQGILLNQGGRIVDAVASDMGSLIAVIPEIGDSVEAGDVVGEAVNRDAAERYRSVLALVEERTRAVEDLKAALEEERALFTKNISQQRQRLQRIERSGRQAVEAARERLQSHQQLFEEGVITRRSVEHSQQALDRLQRELFGTLHQQDELEASEIRHRNEREARLFEARSQRDAAKRRASELKAAVDTQRILAQVTGRVIEIKATVGAALRPGQSVLSIEAGTGPLEALVYIPPTEGKQVKAGMPVLVTPSTVRREEYGSIKGTVASVSAFPVTIAGMVAKLQNRSLAQAISEEGSPYSSRVVLTPDPSTASGFAWTSPKASDETLTSGTLVDAEFKVETQAPITLVVPLLKEKLGV